MDETLNAIVFFGCFFWIGIGGIFTFLCEIRAGQLSEKVFDSENVSFAFLKRGLHVVLWPIFVLFYIMVGFDLDND